MAILSWNFEDGTLQGWVADDANFQIYTSPARGNYSAGIDVGSANINVAHVSPSELDGGVQVEYIEWWWYEGGGGHGGGLQIVDSSGNEVIGVTTSNPNWCIHDNNGWVELSGGNYDTWTHFKVIFDWSAGTVDIEITEEGGSTNTYSSRPLINNTNVEILQTKGFADTNGGWEGGRDQELWWDDIAASIIGDITVTTAPIRSETRLLATVATDRFITAAPIRSNQRITAKIISWDHYLNGVESTNINTLYGKELSILDVDKINGVS